MYVYGHPIYCHGMQCDSARAGRCRCRPRRAHRFPRQGIDSLARGCVREPPQSRIPCTPADDTAATPGQFRTVRAVRV